MNYDEQHRLRFQITIKPEVIKTVLNEVKHGKSLSETALSDLRIVKASIPIGLPKAVSDHLMIEWLANRIIYNLNAIRHTHDLTPLQPTDGRDAVLAQTQKDFLKEDIHLQAWSILYLTFIRVDIHVTDKQLATIAMVSPRTLRRRRQRGYELLLIDIIMEEINIKQSSPSS